jgi:hypothetical protein
MEYCDDISWLENRLRSSIDNHKDFFETFARDDGKFKRQFIEHDPSLITFLSEFHSMTLIKLNQAREALDGIKKSAGLFLNVRSQIGAILDLQRDLTAFFISLAGSLDVAEGQFEILKAVANRTQFNVRNCDYHNIEAFLRPLDRDLGQWLGKNGALSSFRNFLVHRFSLRVLSWTDAGQLSFRECVDPSTQIRALKVFNEPAHTDVRKDWRLVVVLLERLRRAGKLPEVFNPAKVYPIYVRFPIVPIVLLPAEDELQKSPEEIDNFQKQDVRDFCDMNYFAGRKVLGLVYAYLIKMWRQYS